MWLGGREEVSITPVLYLPTVAGGFVAGAVAAGLGLPDWGQLAFGAGLFSWLAVESVLLHRLLTTPQLSAALRPTLGIQLAPPAVGAVTLISVAPHVDGLLVHALIRCALLWDIAPLRLLPWILEEALTPALWSFTFGVTALATAPVRSVAAGDEGAIAALAPILFMAANVVVAFVAVNTLILAASGRLLPPPGKGATRPVIPDTSLNSGRPTWRPPVPDLDHAKRKDRT